MEILVSVVVPTYKRTQLLKRCIEAIIAQTLEKHAYEIIIADDAAGEETRDSLEEIGRREDLPAIRYLPVHGAHGPAAARNCGWRAAQAPIIAFTDDDCIPEPDWLAKGLAAFREDVAGVSGRVIVPLGSSPNDHERNTSLLEHSEFVTANCFYRKTALADVGGFDERFTAAWREDADLFFTLLKRNKRLVSDPETIVIHPVRTAAWGISIREQAKSRFNALLYKKHPHLYKQKIRNPILFQYYAIVFSSFLFLLSLLLGLRGLGVLTFSIWSASLFSVCMKRLRGASRSPKHILEMTVTSLIIPFLSVYWRLAGALRFNVFFY